MNDTDYEKEQHAIKEAKYANLVVDIFKDNDNKLDSVKNFCKLTYSTLSSITMHSVSKKEDMEEKIDRKMEFVFDTQRGPRIFHSDYQQKVKSGEYLDLVDDRLTTNEVSAFRDCESQKPYIHLNVFTNQDYKQVDPEQISRDNIHKLYGVILNRQYVFSNRYLKQRGFNISFPKTPHSSTQAFIDFVKSQAEEYGIRESLRVINSDMVSYRRTKSFKGYDLGYAVNEYVCRDKGGFICIVWEDIPELKKYVIHIDCNQ